MAFVLASNLAPLSVVNGFSLQSPVLVDVRAHMHLCTAALFLFTCQPWSPVVSGHFFLRSCSSSLFLRPFSACTTFGFSLCCRSFPCNDVDLSILDSYRMDQNEIVQAFLQLHRWIGEVVSLMHRANLCKDVT